MKRQLMAEQWNEFSRYVLPKDASEIQRREMKRAFYSGAQSILFRVIGAFAPASEPAEAALQIVSDLHHELEDFMKAMREGRA